jgi:hypothetical protein
MKGIERELGFFVTGGKGATSRRTPSEIEVWGDRLSFEPAPLVYASRMSAKVDNSAVQDGYQLYHHSFLFTAKGSWSVVQQGMNDANRYARRYHWLGETVADFVNEPHAAIASQARGTTLNLVAEESQPARVTVSEIAVNENPQAILADLKKVKTLSLPPHHPIGVKDLRPESIGRILLNVYERQPQDFEQLLGLQGVGAKTLRALSLIAELVHGVAPSYQDPARYSFAHGGKDGYPYPVDKETYDKSIELLAKSVSRAKLGMSEKRDALNRLGGLRR